MATLLVLHGPNLNLLGTREPDIYGHTTLASINLKMETLAHAAGHQLACLQSNAEHELINRVQQAQQENVAFVIINPAGLTHTSVALRDAVAAVKTPVIEVHISNPHAREEFRHTSLISAVSKGIIAGFGMESYALALDSFL